VTPIDTARSELATAVEARMRSALDALASQDDPEAQAVRARLMTAIAQDLQDRAGLVEKSDGDKLRREAKQLVVDAASLAQRAVKAKPDDASANLAMAEVLRLQGKSAHEVRRYLDVAKANAGGDAELAHGAALADALLLSRDGKLDDAAKALAAIDGNDVRVALASALVALAQNHIDDAKKGLDAVLAQAPDQEAAHALQKKLETSVTKTDPLPPEDHAGSGSGAGSGSKKPPTPAPAPEAVGYDALVARGNKLAESNCAKAMEMFQKALDIKSNGVDALVGMGYCHLDAKQFASAFSNFRTALVVSPRFEPALGGIAETYQRQGNKDMAIESWRKYLEVYPNAAKAKKQLEILGAPVDAPPPSPPTPTPTPAPEGSGSGSG
jgi:tetratricopeptide (TPR) repeat protein